MKALKYKLAAAKAAHAALKSPAQMPHVTTVQAINTWLEKYAGNVKYLDQNPQSEKALDNTITRQQLNQRRQILADRDAVLAYRVEKSALAQVVADVQQELYAASQPSDLE